MHMRQFMPHWLRQSIRRFRHGYAIRSGTFGDADPLFQRLPEWVPPGSVAVDVGAAVGTFAIALSRLVGPHGRVIALEPIPYQFEILTCNAAKAPHQNITCLQLAAGATSGTCRLAIPDTDGLPDWYLAHVADAGLPALIVALDDLPIPRPVAFLKVDAEGHDFEVLRGAVATLRRDAPTIFVESHAGDLNEWLEGLGYGVAAADPRSVNLVYVPIRRPDSTT